MKRIFPNFFFSFVSLSAALLIILLAASIYIYNLSKNISYNEGYSHISTQTEIFADEISRITALIGITRNQNSIIKTAFLNTPLLSVNRYAVDLSRKDLVNAVSALSSNTIVDYGIIFQNDICITANRIFDSAEECFGKFLKFPEDQKESGAPHAGFGSPGIFWTPEQKSFNGIMFSRNMNLRYVSYKSNVVFFILNTDVLLDKWLNSDIHYVELYNNDLLIGSYGSLPAGAANQEIIYRSADNLWVKFYIPNSVIWEKIRPALVFIFLSIFFFLVIGFGLSLYFSRKHAVPLQKIASELMRQNRVSSLPANELLFIIHSVEQMESDLEKTHDILRERDRMLRLGMFDRLLAGLVYTEDEWAEARSVFHDFPESWCLCQLRGGAYKNENPEPLRSGVRLSAQIVSEQVAAELPDSRVIVQYAGNDSAVIVLPVTASRPEPESYGSILKETAEFMRTRHQLHISAALSMVFGDIEQLPSAYRQTRQLLRVAGKWTGKTVFSMDDEETNQDQFPLEFTDSQRFYELLQAADTEHAALMVRHFFESFRDRGFVRESVIYHLFWSFEQVFVRIRAENATDKDFRFTLPEYDPRDTIEELIEKILSASGAVCDNVKKSSHRRETELSTSIINYIDENISDPMLNLSGVSAALGLSERYTQTLIRKVSAKSFFEYTDQKRMKMAWTLLSESAIPVNDIAVKCGFALPNSFYKSFKRHFGFPPTDLRKPSDG